MQASAADTHDKKQDQRIQFGENAIRAWRRQLESDPAGAAKIVDHVVERLSARRIFNHYELAAYRSRMMNGVTHPGDYGVNDSNGCVKVA